MQFTPRRTIGGRAWMSLKFPDPRHEAAVALWGNSSLGLLLHWWQANKQQSGRGNVGKEALAKFTLLDPLALTDDQLDRSAALLAERADVPMRPLNEIDLDNERQALDAAFLVDILALPVTLVSVDGPLALLRRKLVREPSINGGKRKF